MSPVRPPWRRDRAGALADFVPREVGRLLPRELRRSLPAPGDGDPMARAEAVFTTLARAGIRYGHEPTTSQPGRQVIREARELLAGPRSGTCLDLAVLYAGACLDAGLHPAVVVLDPARPGPPSHAIVLVWTGGGWPGRANSSYPGLRDPDCEDEAGDPAVVAAPPPGLRARVKSAADAPGDLVAVDCACLAAGEPGAPPGGDWAGLWTAAVHRGSELLRDTAWRWAVGVDIGAGFDARDVLPTLAPPRVEPLVPPYHEADQAGPGHRDGPLAQLRARSKTVPFCARDELDVLRDWFEAGQESLRVALVHGVGGAGKTRLAAELCHRMASDGWYAGFARRRPPQEALDYLAELAQPVLMVVDYPEGIAEDDLVGLLRPLATRSEPIGVLLTARRAGTDTGQWWDTFAKRVGEEDITFAGPALIPLAGQHPNPAAVFRRARTQFVRRAQPQPPDAAADVPLPLPPHVGRWTTLDMVMLAWLSAHGTSSDEPLTRSQLYEKIWDHELDHWQRTYKRRRGEDLRPAAARAAAAAVTALQPPRASVAEVLQRLPVFRGETKWAGDVAEALTWLLPEDGESGIAIRPDPIGDHLLITALDDDPGFLVDLLRAPEPSPSADQSASVAYPVGDDAGFMACAVLSRAAQWHGKAAELAAVRLLQEVPSLWRPALAIALRVGGPFAVALRSQAERQFAAETGTGPDVDAALPWQLLFEAIPSGHSALAELALIASQALLRHLPTDNDEQSMAERAGSLNNLGVRLADAGHREQALGPTQEAVTLYRQLAEANPAAYTSDLAGSLTNLGVRLADAGHREQALGAAQEAVTLYRELAEANPAAYTPDLAMSLTNLCVRLPEAGLREQAVEPAQEAVSLYRELAEADPAAHASALAGSLSNLGARLAEAGHREQALGSALEAVSLFRELAEANPAAYASTLAMSLTNLGVHLAEAGFREQALGPAQEAVALRRELV